MRQLLSEANYEHVLALSITPYIILTDDCFFIEQIAQYSCSRVVLDCSIVETAHTEK